MVRLLSKITTLFVCVLIPASIVAQDTLLISWAETPGLLESTIQADTTADGSQAHDV